MAFFEKGPYFKEKKKSTSPTIFLSEDMLICTGVRPYSGIIEVEWWFRIPSRRPYLRGVNWRLLTKDFSHQRTQRRVGDEYHPKYLLWHAQDTRWHLVLLTYDSFVQKWRICWVVPNNSGIYRFLGIPYQKYSNPGGHCYWTGGQPKGSNCWTHNSWLEY